MDTQPTSQANHFHIHFASGNSAQAVISSAGACTFVLNTLDIRQPDAVINLIGGASGMNGQMYSNLAQLLTESIVQIARHMEILIIDGGTQSGVMAITGQAFMKQPKALTLLGVAPVGRVSYPSKEVNVSDEDVVPLDPAHSHFVLVESDEWGGETKMMYYLMAALSAGRPSIAVLANGGSIAKSEVLQNVRQRRSVIVIEGSGRLADELANLWREKPSSIPDVQLAEIIQYGNLYFFSSLRTPVELVQLIQRLLNV